MEPEMTNQTTISALEIEDLWRVYNTGGGAEVQALKGVSFKIPAGQFIALRGRSGSGKTTLINCIGGLDQPTRGKVSVFGDDPTTMNEKQLARFRREKVAFIFQSFGLSANYSAYENIELKLRIIGVSARERRERTMYCLNLVGLEKWKDHRPEELSGGQQQRVAIARALVGKPRLILADEPTGDLDSGTAREILVLFRKIVDEEKVTMLVSTHDPMVGEYVDGTLSLKDGKLLSDLP
jgi:putative ABC transport system ATP-binding protein